MSAMRKPDDNDLVTRSDIAGLVTQEQLRQILKAELGELKADLAYRTYGWLLTQLALTLGAVYFIMHQML